VIQQLIMAGWSRDQIPVGTRFSTPIQTGPGAYQISYAMGAVSFVEVKQLEHGVDHPPPSSAKVNLLPPEFYI